MARQHPSPRGLFRWLRPSPEGLAAAAALYDPALLLRLRAERLQGKPPASAPAAPCRPPTDAAHPVHALPWAAR